MLRQMSATHLAEWGAYFEIVEDEMENRERDMRAENNRIGGKSYLR